MKSLSCLTMFISIFAIGLAAQAQVCPQPALSSNDVMQGDHAGISISVDGGTMAMGAPRASIGMPPILQPAGAVYIFEWNGTEWVQEQKLQPDELSDPLPPPQERFGDMVSLSGDLLIVGAPGESTLPGGGGANAGAAWIYRYDGNDWIEEDKLQAPTPTANTFFGNHVDIEGDTAVVGTGVGVNPAGSGTGHLFVFEFDGTEWNWAQTLYAPVNQFGRYPQLDGDRLLVGAVNPGGEGEVHVFTHNGMEWVEDDVLVPSDSDVDNQFGGTLALDGDTLMISANQDDELGFDHGAVYVFVHDGNTWEQQDKILPPASPQDGMGFGAGLAVSGNLAVIGAPFLNDDEGEGYLYGFDGTDWVFLETLNIQASTANFANVFGRSVQISNDQLFIGALGDDTFAEDGGAVHIYGCLPSGFIRGDADGDGMVNGLLDGITLLNFAFIPGSPAPPCMDAADVDDDGTFNGIVDGLAVLNFQFIPGSPPPALPYPACGVDPTPDGLDCVVPLVCP